MDVRTAIAVSLEAQKIKQDANSSTRQKKQQLSALRRALSTSSSAKKDTTDESAYRRWLRRHKYITFAR